MSPENYFSWLGLVFGISVIILMHMCLPADVTATPSSLLQNIQNGLNVILVPAHLGTDKGL